MSIPSRWMIVCGCNPHRGPFPKKEREFRNSISAAVFLLTFVLRVASGQFDDMAEGNAAQWGVFASDGAAASVADTTGRVKVGSSAISFSTLSGFDTGVAYPAAPTAHWDLTGRTHLVFWEYAINTTPHGFQGNQPIVVLKTTGADIRLEARGAFMSIDAWRYYKVPLTGSAQWTRTTTGTPTLNDVLQLQIHHDTWDYGFSITFDGVRFATLISGGLPPAGPPPPSGVDPDRIVPRVLLYVYDPIMENFGQPFRRMHDIYGWQDPITLTDRIISDFMGSSHGRVDFQIVETLVVDAYPLFQDGFRHTDETFAADWTARVFHNSTFDYVRFAADQNLPARVDGGEIDEVWIYAPPIAGMWESCMAGAGAYWINGPAYPAAGGQRVYVIMGWNFERGVGEAIHSWGHRAENIMSHSYGNPGDDRGTTWSAFALQDRQAFGLGGVGNVHFPVNGVSDYDYANARFVTSTADDWLNYPNMTGASRSLNFRAWSPNGTDPQREYLNWWYARMPHAGGRGPDFFLANWWRYLTDVDQFKASDGNLDLTEGIPTVRTTSPANGSFVSEAFTVRAEAAVDGALGRVDLYVDEGYVATDTLAPYRFELDGRQLSPGPHRLVTKAYELQNGTEGVAAPVIVTAGCSLGIVEQPVDLTVCEGETVVFHIRVDGAGPFFFQWLRDGMPISGATLDSLTLAEPTRFEAGAYSCTVSNSCAAQSSNIAMLTVSSRGVGDGDGNGVVDGREIAGFVSTLLSDQPSGMSFCAYDLNLDRRLDSHDVRPFVDRLVGWP